MANFDDGSCILAASAGAAPHARMGIRAAIYACALACLCAPGCANSPRPSHEAPNASQAVRPFPLASAPEELRHLVSGKAAVVDLWATWCATCETEQPKFQRFAEVYADSGLVIASVAVGDDEDSVAQYRRHSGLTYPVYTDPSSELADALGATELPMILVLDENAAIVHRSSRIDRETLKHVRRVVESVRPAL